MANIKHTVSLCQMYEKYMFSSLIFYSNFYVFSIFLHILCKVWKIVNPFSLLPRTKDKCVYILVTSNLMYAYAYFCFSSATTYTVPKVSAVPVCWPQFKFGTILFLFPLRKLAHTLLHYVGKSIYFNLFLYKKKI